MGLKERRGGEGRIRDALKEGMKKQAVKRSFIILHGEKVRKGSDS